MLFSATMPKKIQTFAKSALVKPGTYMYVCTYACTCTCMYVHCECQKYTVLAVHMDTSLHVPVCQEGWECVHVYVYVCVDYI